MARVWKVEAEWRGQTVVVLASGPSMSQAVADIVRGKCRVIVVNSTYKLAPWADILYAADHTWWTHNPEAQNFAGRRVTIYPIMDSNDAMYLHNGGSSGLDSRRSYLRTGKNSGYQAMHLALHLGAKRILLCGFDMRPGHWHPEHPEEVRKPMPFSFWVKKFNEVAPMYAARGVHVINCTPNSALACFEKQKLEIALESMSADKRPAAISA